MWINKFQTHMTSLVIRFLFLLFVWFFSSRLGHGQVQLHPMRFYESCLENPIFLTTTLKIIFSCIWSTNTQTAWVKGKQKFTWGPAIHFASLMLTFIKYLYISLFRNEPEMTTGWAEVRQNFQELAGCLLQYIVLNYWYVYQNPNSQMYWNVWKSQHYFWKHNSLLKWNRRPEESFKQIPSGQYGFLS